MNKRGYIIYLNIYSQLIYTILIVLARLMKGTSKAMRKFCGVLGVDIDIAWRAMDGSRWQDGHRGTALLAMLT